MATRTGESYITPTGQIRFQPLLKRRSRYTVKVVADEREVARRYLRGETLRDIAISMDLTANKVSKILDEVRERWREESERDLGTAIAEQLARINALELEYRLAWERSQQPHEVEETREEEPIIPPDQGDHAGQRAFAARIGRRIARLKKEGRVGDAAFLEGIRWCISERSKLLGLNAPERVNISVRLRQMADEAGIDPDLVQAELIELQAQHLALPSGR